LDGASASGRGQVHAMPAGGEPRRLDQLVLAEALEDALHDVGCDPQVLRQLLDRRLAKVEERLQREVLDHAPPNAQPLRRNSVEIRTQHSCTPIVWMLKETTMHRGFKVGRTLDVRGAELVSGARPNVHASGSRDADVSARRPGPSRPRPPDPVHT